MSMRHPGAVSVARAALVLAASAASLAFAAPLHAQAVPGPLAPLAREPDTSPTGPARPTNPEAATEEAEALVLLQQARVAMLEQRWGEAELLLERALMLQPANAEVMVDLARLLASRGRGTSGLAILQVLLDDPRTPAPQRLRLQELAESIRQAAAGPGAGPTAPVGSNARAAAAVAETPGAHLWAEWSVGHGRNPLLTTANSFITITLPDGNFQLPLETTARPATYTATSLGWRGSGGQEAQLQAQHFNLSGVATTWRAQFLQPLLRSGNSQDPTGNAVMRNGGPWTLGVSWRAFQFTDQSRRHQASLEWQQGAWALTAGVYDEQQRQRSGTQARLSHLRQWAGARPLQLSLWAERETNQDAGAPGYEGVGFSAQWQMAPAWTLQAGGSAQRDTRGYNPLLSNNAPRRLASTLWSLEHTPPFKAGAGFFVFRAYQTSRQSNISLFQGKDQGMQVLWRYLR